MKAQSQYRGGATFRPQGTGPFGDSDIYNRLFFSYNPSAQGGLSRGSSFPNAMKLFPWDQFEMAANRNNSAAIRMFVNLLIDLLTGFIYMEPLVAPNETCVAPQLQTPSEIDCAKYPGVFLKNKRKTPVKVAHAIQLGFDADTLEIHLNEVYDIVDYFFVLESLKTHCELVSKDLMWNSVKNQRRFKKFSNKVVHFVLDDADTASIEVLHTKEKNIWKLEKFQEKRIWQKIKEWNIATHALGENDVIGFGDADEVPSRSNVHLFKYCTINGTSVDIGIWFPYGYIGQAFRTDFPVSKEYPYTLGDPTFFTFGAAVNLSSFPTRMRGLSGRYLLGGMHMTHYMYLPFLMAKHLSQSECPTVVPNSTKTVEVKHYRDMAFFKRRPASSKIKPVSDLLEELKTIMVIPWFLKCNMDRYPAWKGLNDSRLE